MVCQQQFATMSKWNVQSVIQPDKIRKIHTIILAVQRLGVSVVVLFRSLMADLILDGTKSVPESRNVSILTIVPASVSSCISNVNISSKSVIAGTPCMLSFFCFDSYGNKVDASSTVVGVRVQNEGSTMLISNNVFYSIGNSAGTVDFSAMMYSSGNHSISTLQGFHGKFWFLYVVGLIRNESIKFGISEHFYQVAFCLHIIGFPFLACSAKLLSLPYLVTFLLPPQPTVFLMAASSKSPKVPEQLLL